MYLCVGKFYSIYIYQDINIWSNKKISSFECGLYWTRCQWWPETFSWPVLHIYAYNVHVILNGHWDIENGILLPLSLSVLMSCKSLISAFMFNIIWFTCLYSFTLQNPYITKSQLILYFWFLNFTDSRGPEWLLGVRAGRLGERGPPGRAFPPLHPHGPSCSGGLWQRWDQWCCHHL